MKQLLRQGLKASHSFKASHTQSICARRHLSYDVIPKSFIQKAALNGVESLIGEFYTAPNGYFDKCMRSLKIDSVDTDTGKVFCSIVVEKELENSFASLHGGAISTIVDICGTLAILSKDKDKPGVSVELNVSFCSSAKAGSTVLIEGSLTKLGKTLAFTEIKLFDKESGRIIATGRHTKFV